MMNPKNLPDCAAKLSRELMLQASLHGDIEKINPAWTNTLGWSEVELGNRQLLDLVHPDDLQKAQDELARLTIGGGTTSAFDTRFQHRDGSYRWISWKATAEGKNLCATGLDTTDEKGAIASLNESREALRLVQRMDAIGQMSGGVAHDFNNLLQNILSALELMRRLLSTGRSGEAQKLIAGAVGSAQRAASLNHRLLSFSRRQPPNARALDMNELISGLEDLLRPSLPASIKLDVELSANLWETFCDWPQAENAVVNLFLNARDAMPVGGTITILTHNAYLEKNQLPLDLPAGQYVSVVITDSGAGTSEEVASGGFGAFSPTQTSGLEMRLGLSMVQLFARQNKGDARIHSEPGHGTCVTLYLPRYESGRTGF